jgi:hypothetical protein
VAAEEETRVAEEAAAKVAAAEAAAATEAAAAVAAADAMARARVEHKIKEPVAPVTMELQERANFTDKSPPMQVRAVETMAAQLEWTSKPSEILAIFKREATQAVFSGDFGTPTPGVLSQVEAATTMEDFEKEELQSVAAIRRARFVIGQRDRQLGNLVVAAIEANSKQVALLADAVNVMDTTPGLVTPALMKLLGAEKVTSTTKDAEQAEKVLKGSRTDWSQDNVTPVEAVEGATRVVARAFAIFTAAGYKVNYTKFDRIKRILDDDAIGKNSPNFKEFGEKVESRFKTWDAMNVSQEQQQTDLIEFAKSKPKKKVLDLASDTPGIVSSGAAGSGEIEANLRARVKALEAQVTQYKSGGGGVGASKDGGGGDKNPTRSNGGGGGTNGGGGGVKTPTRAAAASTKTPPAGSADAQQGLICKFCKAPGHKVENCTKVTLVAGKDGTEMVPWAQCWQCESFGHFKRFCPQPPTPAPDSRLNGSASSSAGGGSAR